MAERQSEQRAILSVATQANATVVIPAGWAIRDVFMSETAGAAVTGGIRIGTTNGGTDVALALAVGANSFGAMTASILKRAFSPAVDQTLFIQAVTLWNGASVDIVFTLDRAIP